MGLVRRDEVEFPQRSDYRVNINRTTGNNKLDKIPFVHNLAIPPGEFILRYTQGLNTTYTIPTGKKFLLTYIYIENYDPANERSVDVGGKILLNAFPTGGAGVYTQNNITFPHPIEIKAGEVITVNGGLGLGKCSFAGFLVEN